MAQNTSHTPSNPGRWVIPKFGGPEVLEWQTFSSLPVVPPGSVKVRILIAGVSGADNIMRAGGYTRDPRTVNPGFTPGYDLVGVVEAMADDKNTHGIREGDLITTMSVVGAYATHTVVPLDEILKLRPDDDLIKAAALPLNYMTAFGMLQRSAFPIDSSTKSILIGAVAGGVGTAVAQIAHLLFPYIQLFGTCSASKFETVRSLGVIPIDRRLPPAEIVKTVRALTDGEGVDVAYEATGSEETLESWLAATRDGLGKVIAIGLMANIRPDGTGMMEAASNPIAFTAARPDRMSFFSVTNHYWRQRRAEFRQDFENIVLKAVRDGRLDPVIGSLWQLKDAVKINEMLATGQGVSGKIEMLVDPTLWEKYGSKV